MATQYVNVLNRITFFEVINDGNVLAHVNRSLNVLLMYQDLDKVSLVWNPYFAILL